MIYIIKKKLMLTTGPYQASTHIKASRNSRIRNLYHEKTLMQYCIYFSWKKKKRFKTNPTFGTVKSMPTGSLFQTKLGQFGSSLSRERSLQNPIIIKCSAMLYSCP